MSKILRRECVRTGTPLRLKKTPLVRQLSETEARAAADSLRAQAEQQRREMLALAAWKAQNEREQAGQAYTHARDAAYAEGEAAGRRQGGDEAACALAQLRGQLKKEMAAHRRQNEQTLQAGADRLEREAEDFAFALAEKILRMPLDRSLLRDVLSCPAADGEPDASAAEVPLPAEPEETPPERASGVSDEISPEPEHTRPVRQMPADGENQNPVPDMLPDGVLQHLSGRSMQRLLKAVRLQDIVLAMKGLGSADGTAVCAAMPRHMRESVEHELSFLGPVRPSDVKQAQKRISGAIRRLLDTGEIQA